MSKYIEYFDEHVDYEEFKQSQDYIKPNVSYCKNEEEIHYEDEEETRVVCKYNITDIEEPTVLGQQFNYFSKMYVDDIEVTKATSYLFNTTGTHIVKFIPSSTVLYQNCFRGSTALEEVWIPNSITSTQSNVFYQCTNLKKVRLSDNLVSLGDSSFYNCSSLYDIRLPLSFRTFTNWNTFANCISLIKINIPEGVVQIPRQTFTDCTNLQIISIPSTVNSIGEAAFTNCTGLKKVNIKSIDSWLGIYFNQWQSNPLARAKHLYIDGVEVTSIVVPQDRTSIRQYSLYNASSITSITLHNNITAIGASAFFGCSSAVFNLMPNSLVSIGGYAFQGCTGFNLDVVLPSGFKTIDVYAFNASNIHSLYLPSTTTSVGNSIVYNCKNLEAFEIDEDCQITTTGSYLCRGCSKLSSVKLPKNLTVIGWGTFWDCTAITSLVIPASVTSIEAYAFLATKLASLTMLPTTPPSLVANAFNSTPSTKIIYVPAESVETYKTASVWSNYANNIQAIP